MGSVNTRSAALVGLVVACTAGLPGTAPAATEPCPSAALRVGPSASLPDCRVYELVTPADKGRTQDMTFNNGNDYAIPSRSGEGVALETIVPVGADASIGGTRGVFLRTSSGWVLRSAVAPGTGAHRVGMLLFSPDLSRVALEWETAFNLGEHSSEVDYEVGPVGGPYKVVASVPYIGVEAPRTRFMGASSDFGHVLLESTDHALLSGAEGAVAEGTDEGMPNLYEWTAGHLRLVNVTSEGRLVNQCGAMLGDGSRGESRAADNAVSEDGTTIFFTSPVPRESGPGCEEPPHLYMRVGGSETVDISAPQGVTVNPGERREVRYNGATPDGSKVFFNTETALTPDDTTNANKLFEYDTGAPEGERLTRIASGVTSDMGGRNYAVVSEDGSAVYYETGGGGSGSFSIYRYDIGTGTTRFVATGERSGRPEPPYATPNGEFFLFWSEGTGVVGELRGSGHKELYRYDNADGSVMCVSCGSESENAPATGDAVEPGTFTGLLETPDETPAVIPVSNDGQYVFFQTTAQLVPQDTNTLEDVYEWQADGAGGCVLPQGCTYLLSSGEDVGPSTFLGASASGRDVFFATAARLAPQDTDEFSDIYDARVNGGFAPERAAPECLICQGVGSPPPLFSVPTTASFVGPGNPAVKAKPKPKHRAKPKRKSKRRGRSSRVAQRGGWPPRVGGGRS